MAICLQEKMTLEMLQQSMIRFNIRKLNGLGNLKKSTRFRRMVFFLVFPILFIIGISYELATSRLQALYLSHLANQSKVVVATGPSPSIRFPQGGPYDDRLGYVDLPAFMDKLAKEGYRVQSQARFSSFMLRFSDRGFYVPYNEKPQAGLSIYDRYGLPLYSAVYPERIYTDFNTIPDIAVKSLLFIENRELLETRYPYKNPVLEWKRLARALFEFGLSRVDHGRSAPGGSTLATQIEKYRHSPGGQTASVKEKYRQMFSAGVRAYLDGEKTVQSRRWIVLDFFNSMPLGAISGFGEISGIGDGLYAWYGADFKETNRILLAKPKGPDAENIKSWARSLKQVLSLIVAQRRPTYYLIENRPALQERTDDYLKILTESGIIETWERDAAIAVKLDLKNSLSLSGNETFLARKAANAVRNNLLNLLGIQQLYELNHLDLSVDSTIDRVLQQRVSTKLKQLNEADYAQAAGLREPHLLGKNDPAGVIYSFALYERVEGANLLRVKTDTYNQPLDINSGTKLELGSSAKLRTLATYLEIIAALHDRYAGMSPSELEQVEVASGDKLSRWVINYLKRSKEKDISAILSAAMQRKYYAGTKERFFTGGGIHTFTNFDAKHNGGNFTVERAFTNSINLVFIRLMRDIVEYYKYQIPGVNHLLADAKDPKRSEYLSKFADIEGITFLRRFYRKYSGKPYDEILSLFLKSVRHNPKHLAAVFRYVNPETDFQQFKTWLSIQIQNSNLSESTIAGLYEEYGPPKKSLVDRGYISRIHPLELWIVAYLHQHPDATFDEIKQASNSERQEVYTWLFNTSRKNKQDVRIRTLLEIEAFSEINASWKRLKYPFDTLVPSYATAIGSSADKPAALSELMGIILHGGKWYPTIQVESLRFGESTPYETHFIHQCSPGEQVMRREIAEILKQALQGVVESGTAKRINRAFLLSNGTPLAVGGKTGTGDNRYDIFGSGGKIIRSSVINRAAVFVFFLGDRFYGTITAYVASPEAAKYRFTSSLPTQILKILAPELMPLLYPEAGLEADRMVVKSE
jgi:membrane peptidoglycan carboxypeptidase